MALNLYPPSAHNVFHNVNIQYPQHVDQAVQQIYAACKGMGTDEQTLISVLGSKSPEARTLIAMRYQALYNKPLKDLIKSETSGDFGRLLRMISTPLHETEAQLLYDATKGMGTNESQITQIVSGRTNAEMDILKKTYFRLFNKDLTVTLNSELSGDFKKVVVAMLQSQQEPFNPSVHTAMKAEDDAVQLYKAGQGRMGTNEEVFIGILVKCPTEYLKMVDAAYVRKYNNNIAKAIDKEFSGDAKKALNYLVKSVMDPYPTIAELFESTMKGFGTRETALSTTIVRYHCVLPGVKTAFKKMYGKELRDRINGETSGDYRRLLLEIYDAPQDAGVNAVPAGAKPAATVPGAAPPGAAPTGYPAPAGYGAAQPPTPGFTNAYPAPAGQTTPGGYPPAAQGYPAPGHPPAHAAASGYPPQQSPAPGYPAQQAPAPAPGYPPHQPAPAGYPTQQQPAPGYPPHQQAAPGYPPQQQPAPGYPPHQPAPAGYPPQQAAAPGYPPHQPAPTYPPQQPAYPGHAAPAPGAYPPQAAPGYPSQAAPGYPPQQQQYPPAAQGYPPQGYPPAAQGYPPQAYPPQGQYPPQAYPPQGQYPPQGAPGYPPQQGYPGYRY